MNEALSSRSRPPRVAVYAIARNEEQHVDRWVASARDADLLLIADTGSSDETVRRARELGVVVHEIRVDPFRYDAARNRALDLLPADVDLCVSLDLDEVLVAGWRPLLEEAWNQGATRIRCWFEWRWSADYPPLSYSTDQRIHARHGFRWRFPVHEQIEPLGAETVVESAIQIHHLRSSLATRPHYLDLLYLGVAEHPDDGRMAHLLANEARMRGRMDEARFHMRRALTLPLPPNERLHALLMLAHFDPSCREECILAACAEFPARREPWCELAQLQAERGEWRACQRAARNALRIVEPADDYLANSLAWGPRPERLAAVASLELGQVDVAVHHARRAVQAAPHSQEQVDLLDRAIEAVHRRRRSRPSVAAPAATGADGAGGNAPVVGDRSLAIAPVDIIIPTWNNAPFLEAALFSLLTHRTMATRFRILVVNNGDPRSCDWISSPEVEVVQTGGQNLGWTGGLKRGLAHSSAPFVCFFNDDAYIPPNSRRWLDRLLLHFQDDDVGAVGPSSNFVTGPQNIFANVSDAVISTRFLIGFCLLVRRSALDAVGGIDDTLPGGDDFDLSIRLRRASYRLIADRDVFVYHHGSRTGPRIYGDSTQPGGWDGEEFRQDVEAALIRKHGLAAWQETVQGLRVPHA